MTSTGDKQFDRAVRRLRSAFASMQESGPDKLRRGKALAALRSLRAAVDKFPVKIERSRKSGPKGFAARVLRLREQGWREVSGDRVLGEYALAGAPTRKIVAHDATTLRKIAEARTYVKRTPPRSPARREWVKYLQKLKCGVKMSAHLVPAWAHAVGPDPAKIRAAKQSRLLRDAARAGAAIGGK